MNKTREIIPQINNQLEQFKSSIDVIIVREKNGFPLTNGFLNLEHSFLFQKLLHEKFVL